MKENYDRLVNVYIDNNININHDFLYILKEKNILNIDDVSIIPHDKYLNYLEVIKNFKE